MFTAEVLFKSCIEDSRLLLRVGGVNNYRGKSEFKVGAIGLGVFTADVVYEFYARSPLICKLVHVNKTSLSKDNYELTKAK